MGVMTAPESGSGTWPACTALVANPDSRSCGRICVMDHTG